MAATAYSSLVSLMNVLTRYQNPTCPVPFHQSQVQTLLDKVTSLIEFLEDYYDLKASPTSRGSIQSLERKMTSVSNAAEDLIETSYVNRVLKREELEIWPDLQNSIQEMDQIIQESMDVRVKRHKNKHQPTPTSSHVYRDKNIMVGFDKQLSRLMDKIRMSRPSLKIIPIVGMGGIGKTTLATNVYCNPYARRHFDICGWVTISQQYVVKNIITSLLRDMKAGGNDQLDVEVLGDMLYKHLYGRRYLIILDDIWDTHVWDEVRRFFPDNNGSRILLTTRDHSVARKVCSSSTYEMELLDDDGSFDLLSTVMCGSEAFPHELEILGKSIAKSCKGLPLAIVVIGGLLKTCSKALEYWKDFAEDLGSIISKDISGQCLEIISLSYTHLPIHLKSCFLHLATFEEDASIEVSNLINLWIAEGFLKPSNDKILNETALGYLNELIDRNIVVTGTRGRTVNMHDSLRELCLREAENEDFLCVVDEDTANLQQRLQRARRIVFKHSIQGSKVLLPSMLYARSISIIGDRESSTQLASLCRLLRVINNMKKSELQMDIEELFNVRYLEVLSERDVEKWCSSLPLLWNLEILILLSPGPPLPSEIWDLHYLRHMCYSEGVLGPLVSQSNRVLINLQAIWDVEGFFCSDEVFRRIPNLKELSIRYNIQSTDYVKLSYSLNNLARLRKLEMLRVDFYCSKYNIRCALNEPEKLTFSHNLVELDLKGSDIPWENMTIVGCLPNLQVLVLWTNAFSGSEWNSIEGEFQRLKRLSIWYCNLSTWNMESCHFPMLEHLGLTDIFGLKEIPSGIGEIESLKIIYLTTPEISTLISVKEIFDDRINNQGDDEFLVHVRYKGDRSEQSAEVDMWAESHKNFQMY